MDVVGVAMGVTVGFLDSHGSSAAPKGRAPHSTVQRLNVGRCSVAISKTAETDAILGGVQQHSNN